MSAEGARPPGCARVFLSIILILSASPLFSQNIQPKPDALVEYRTGNYERAVSICQEEIAANAANMDAHVVICWSYIRLGKYVEAERYALAARNISRYDPRIIEILGEANYYQGKNTDALRYFQEYVSYAPDGGRVDLAYFFMGEIYIRLGKFRSADIALSTAAHWQPNNAEWLARLAYAKESVGSLADAVAAYERALSVNPQLADAKRGLERARKALGGRR
jgi:tetratricopeptide (TPR) repeat protein